MTRPTLCLIALLLVVGCRAQPEAGNDSAPTSNVADLNRTAPVSIIRNDVRAEMEEDTLAEVAPTIITIGFPDGGAELDEAAKEVLGMLLASDKIAGDQPLLLSGHSDTVGSDEANFRAGKARAEAVAKFLSANGVAAARITVVSLGEGNPVEPNFLADGSDNAAGQAANRRVEILVGDGSSSAPAMAPAEAR